MSNLLSKFINNIEAYTAGEQPRDKNYIKLNTNENPFPPSPVIKKILNNYDYDKLKLYPDPNSSMLKAAISKKENTAENNIFIGNGSDEVLAFCFPTFFNRKEKDIAFADITYSFYPVFSDFFGINFRKIRLDDNFTLNCEDYFNLKDIQGIIIANPNAPTGKGIALEIIEKIVKSNLDKVIIIDEAYIDFFKQSAVELTKKYNNLLVVKTFSKSYSLAGIRCGYAIGNETLISGLERSKNCFNSYPIDRLCEAVCTAAISDSAYYDGINNEIISERGILQQQLKEIGLTVIPSSSNFIFAGLENKGKILYEKLKEQGILVRYFDKERLKSFVRISVGSKTENLVLITKLKDIIREINQTGNI